MNVVGLAAKREIVTAVRSRAFQIGVGVMVLIAFAGTAAPGLVSRLGGGEKGELVKVALVGALDGAGLGAGALPGFELKPVADEATAAKELRAKSVEAALVPDPESPAGLKVVALEREPSGLVDALTVRPAVELLEPPAVPDWVRMIVSVLCAVVFMMIVLLYAQSAATNTVIEKQTRVVEILLAAVPARSLLAGRIIGFSVLAFGSVALIVAALMAGLAVGGGLETGGEIVSALDTAVGGGLWGLMAPALVWFLVLFIVAFVLFAALMVASAATVSRIEDVSAVATPAMILIMIPYILTMMFQDNPTVIRVMSYIPISAPTAMPPRLVAGDAAWWEPPVALALLLVTTWGVIVLAGRVFENSVLQTGARIKFKDAWRRSS
ncbi:MAG: ABC transporter permease [Bifidobacteriaceae bacterium]|nr:ABC transporter permease [Bifidobacteriaceae bacterium]